MYSREREGTRDSERAGESDREKERETGTGEEKNRKRAKRHLNPQAVSIMLSREFEPEKQTVGPQR